MCQAVRSQEIIPKLLKWVFFCLCFSPVAQTHVKTHASRATQADRLPDSPCVTQVMILVRAIGAATRSVVLTVLDPESPVPIMESVCLTRAALLTNPNSNTRRISPSLAEEPPPGFALFTQFNGREAPDMRCSTCSLPLPSFQMFPCCATSFGGGRRRKHHTTKTMP